MRTQNKGFTMKVKGITGLILSLALLAGCAKERPDQITQAGQVDLLQVSAFQGVEYDLKATGKLRENSPISSANSISIASGTPNLNTFNLLKYETNSPHFDDVPVFGKAGVDYKLKYEITEQHLIINKIAKKDEIPFNERTYGSELPNGYMSVPVVGYPLTLYKLDRILNADNEATHNLTPVPVTELSQATHFKMQSLNRVMFNDVEKFDVFDADLLNGEWFYAATIVAASPELAPTIGRDLSFDFKARSVSRIKFIKRSDAIVGVNLNVDENINRDEEINLKKAIRIPTKWLDYKRKMVGNQKTLTEEEIGDGHDEKRPFNERAFMKLEFTQVDSILGSLFDTQGAILDRLEMDKDYLSFVIYYPKNETKIRYALRKAHQPKQGRVYYKDDRKTFGFFTTVRDVIRNHRLERDEDYEKNIFMNRFIPDDNKIVYFFSEGTPEHMRDAGRKSIIAWDKAFQEAGTGIRVLLDESKDVPLGDLRFNIINIVDTKDGSGLLGYGPSIVDSESGEIISATSNIYANPFRESWIETIRNYVRSELGLFNKNHIVAAVNGNNSNIDEKTFLNFVSAYGKSLNAGPILNLEERLDWLDLLQKKSLDNSLVDIDSESIISQEQRFTEKIQLTNNNEETKLLESIIDMYHRAKNDSQGSKLSFPQSEGFGHVHSFSSVAGDAIRKIETECKDLIEPYIAQAKTTSNGVGENELEVLNQCADRLLEESVISTLVHELGHNFGLRHNFLASTDPENFTKGPDGKPISLSSSIMDYQTNNVDELIAPGAYDVEAIRFGYAAKYQKENGEIGEIALDKSFAQQLAENGIERRVYKFCTDEHVTVTDPLCQRHDHGANPSEIVDSVILNFNSIYAVYGHRYDRAFGSSGARLAMAFLSRTFIPLKMIYDQWRFYLREFVGERNQYLDNYSKEELAQVLEEMKKDTGKHGKHYAEYFEASQKAYQFLKDLAFTSSKQCIAKKDQSFKLFDYEEVRETIYNDTSVEIDDCDHPLALSHFQELGFEFYANYGKFFNDQRTSLDISDIDYNNNDAVGLNIIRSLANMIITARLPLMQHLAVEGFAPNFMDDPNFREEMVLKTYRRILTGLDPQDLPEGVTVNEANATALLSFKTEKDLLTQMALSIRSSMAVPDKIDLNLQRSRPFSVIKTSNPQTIPEAATVRTVFANTIIATTPQNSIAAALIQTRERLRQSKAAAEADIIIMPDQVIDQILAILKQQQATMSLEEITSEEFTIAGLKEKLAKLAPVLQQLGQVLGRVQGTDPTFLQNFFFLENALVNVLAQVPEEQLQQPAKAFVVQILTQNGLTADDYDNMAEENWPKKVENYKQTKAQQIAQAENFREKRDDYEAQLDLITEILLRF